MTTLRPLPVLLLVLCAACSGSDDPAALAREGVASLNARDYVPAYNCLDRAVRELPDDHPRALEVRVALCRTLAHGRPEDCVDRLAELAREREDLQVADAALVVRELIAAEEFGSIKRAVQVTQERFGESEELAGLVHEARKAAERADRPDAVKDMEDLGYTAGKD